MDYTKEQYKTVACQLVDMIGNYNGYDMAFKIQPRYTRCICVEFWNGEDLKSFYFHDNLSAELNMQGLREWMQAEGLV